MTDGLIHVGDCPTFRDVIKDQDGVVVDVSGASTKDMIFRLPDGTASVENTSFTGDGTDGKIEWTPTDELDQVGKWQRQSKVIIAGKEWKAVKKNFTVHEALPES